MQKFAIWIQTASLFMLKQMIFTKISQKLLKTRFDTSNFEIERPLPKGKNKKVIGLMKDESGG